MSVNCHCLFFLAYRIAAKSALQRRHSQTQLRNDTDKNTMQRTWSVYAAIGESSNCFVIHRAVTGLTPPPMAVCALLVCSLSLLDRPENGAGTYFGAKLVAATVMFKPRSLFGASWSMMGFGWGLLAERSDCTQTFCCLLLLYDVHIQYSLRKVYRQTALISWSSPAGTDVYAQITPCMHRTGERAIANAILPGHYNSSCGLYSCYHT